MKRLNNSGFTIIETMLFLGITGLLIAGVMTSVGSSINVQRYRDSIVSLQSLLQKQYSEVSNVNNTNSGGCTSTPGVQRGQSDCVIIGRYITTNNGKTLTIKTVFLSKIPNTTVGQDDIAALSATDINFGTLDSEVYETEWGVLLSPEAFSILIIQSPSSGVIRTFINPNQSVPGDSIRSLVNIANLVDVKICVSPNGLSGEIPSAVLINTGSANASGVETKGEATSGC